MRAQRGIPINKAALEVARVRRLLGVRELAVAAGISEKTLWVARGGGVVSFRTARRLAAVLHVEPDEIVLQPSEANALATAGAVA